MAASASSLLCKALPIDVDNVKFAEPWEARAFALIVKLADNGYFTWGEWVECFSKEVAAATAAEAAGAPAKTYYEQWLNAAENLMVAKGAASREQLAAQKSALAQAAPSAQASDHHHGHDHHH
jgi:nitrile hydratase accessory protein